MKIRGIMSTLFAVALIFAPQFVNSSSAASGKYSAQLISPTAGQVLYPGQKARVEWRSVLPPINLAGCEAEVWLSLDGGRSFTMCITPVMDPKAQYFYWTVPNLPLTQPFWTFASGVKGGIPKITHHNPRRCLPSQRVRCRRTKFCSQDQGGKRP